MATYIKPNAIKDASIEGIKIKDGTISSSKIDETVASKNYVDTQITEVGEGITAMQEAFNSAYEALGTEINSLTEKTTALDSRTPVDSKISFTQPWEHFPEYSEDAQDVQNYILPGFLQINNQMTSVDGLFNHIRDNNLAGKAAYFTIKVSSGPDSAIIGNIDDGPVGYKISFSTISRYSDNTSFNNRLIFFEIEIGDPFGDGITIMNSRLMNICIKDTLSQIDNNISKIQTLETKTNSLDSRTPVDSGIGIDAMSIPEYSTNPQDLSYYYFSINGNSIESYTQLHNYIIENDLAGKDIYFRLTSMGGQYSKILGHIDVTGCFISAYGVYCPQESQFISNGNFICLNIELDKQSDGTYILSPRGLLVNYNIDKIKENSNAVQITYAELKALRDAGNLVPGTQYRITDYTCTTTQANTKSAGHVFDIIVTADDERTLNEVAKAVKHEGDAYFANSDLNAWKLWYCLDNDTTRFNWADGTETDGKPNGKGVIYRMIDEFNNDVPYDFKNIQFYRKWDSGKSLWSTISSDNTGVPCYTFSSSGNSATTLFTDMSLVASNNVYSNVIKKYVSSNKQTLNNNCFFGNNFRYNTFGGNCSSNTFGNNCLNNTFGNNCLNNTFGNNYWNNTFGNDFKDNTFGNKFRYNTFGNNCYSNTFGNNCSSNTFGNYCYSNTFGNDCSSNTFGNDCGSNTFGNNFKYNTFGNNCSSNTFGNDCSSNTFGNYCYSNTFGNNCSSNTFGNYCSNIKLASDASATTKYNYYQHNHFGDGCQYIVFTGAETASSSAQVQNYNFAQGLKGTSSAYLTIDGVRNLSYETYISKDTDGAIKESVIAEKLDKVIEISYNDLVTLRGSSKLVPGQQYRITDYTCTTAQEDTRSAGHQFDVIVTADSKNKLNENARAIQHTDDTYFANSKLESWELKYCLDNDTTRFAWADTVNGKGVIYWMKDEYDNECPYDFKNIQFKRYAVTNVTSTKLTSDALNDLKNTFIKDSNGGLYFATKDSDGNFVPSYEINENDSNWYYTFQGISRADGSTINKMYDLTVETFKLTNECISSLEGDGSGADTEDYCRENKIEQFNQEYFGDNIYYKGRQILNNIVFIGGLNYCYQDEESYWNYNTSSIYGNRFGVNCNNNTFGNDCYSNTFGNDFRYNTFGNYCGGNTFGNDFQTNTFGNNFQDNTFGNRCLYNSFGNYCQENTFGNNCYYNTFGNHCGGNTFGNNFQDNTFGNNFQESQFGDGVQHFSITNKQMATEPSSEDVKGYIKWLIVENGVKYVNAYVTGSTSSSSQCQNVRICLGIQGVKSYNKKTFDITSCINSKVNNVYQPENSQTTNV